jgi:hypothetical protein
MPRRLRFVPEGGALVEVTCRAQQGRLLLLPSPELNDIVLGVLGRAQRLYPVRLCAYVFLANHFHLLLDIDDAQQLSLFMGYFNSNLAREIARRTGWEDKVWGRRYQAIPVSDEEPAQVARLEYLLSHGCKEGLVEHVIDWPGVHCATALLTGDPVEGTWFDRTQEWAARQRGESFAARRYALTEEVVLSPLPCWRHLSPELYRKLVAGLIDQIEARAAATRVESGAPVLGAVAIRDQHPHDRPKRLKKSPAPFFHAFTKSARKLLRESYSRFLTAFREAAASLKAGDRTACFPVGCFPPGLPFVTATS